MTWPRCRCGHTPRYRLGEIVAGPETRVLHDKAEQWINGEGIVSPARWVGCTLRLRADRGESIETTY